MKIYRIAVGDGEFRDLKDSVKNSKDDIRDLKGRVKDLESKIKSLEKDLSDLNIGQRRFFQDKTSFNSIERKLERLESLEQDWKNFKKEMPDNVRQEVEKSTKARVSTIIQSK